jgi:hypothetical protein
VAGRRLAFYTPNEGWRAWVADEDKLYFWDGSGWIAPSTGGGGGAAGKNLLINGDMRVWQRQNGGAAAAANGVYGVDRWYHLNQSAGVTISQLADAENSTPSMLRITQPNASAQRFGVAQAIEGRNCKFARGQTVALSARVRCSNSTTLRYAILEWTGTEDAVTKDVVNDWTSGTYTAGNFFKASNMVVTAVGSLALTANTFATLTTLVATLGSSLNNLIVFLWTESTQAQSSTLDIGKVQIEEGAAATAFERQSWAKRVEDCERYYQKTYNLDTAPGANTYNGAVGGPATHTDRVKSTFIFRTRMRGVPSITLWDPGTANTTNAVRDDSNTQIAFTSPAFDGADESGFRNCRNGGGSALTAGAGYNFHYTADAEL